MHREKAAVGEEFLYRGGRLSPDLPASNVPDVVAAICRLLGPFSGYIGFDLVIDGRGQAHVVEINPRLTTSYVGYSAWLRKEAGEQAGLGRWMLGEHRELPQLTRTFRFTTNGDVTIA
jgi:predicted ATP-grasp superfamily ATP-dependent carboligase